MDTEHADVAEGGDDGAMAQAGLYVLMAVAVVLLAAMLLAVYWRSQVVQPAGPEPAAVQSTSSPTRDSRFPVVDQADSTPPASAPREPIVPKTAPLDLPHTARVVVPEPLEGGADTQSANRPSR